MSSRMYKSFRCSQFGLGNHTNMISCYLSTLLICPLLKYANSWSISIIVFLLLCFCCFIVWFQKRRNAISGNDEVCDDYSQTSGPSIWLLFILEYILPNVECYDRQCEHATGSNTQFLTHISIDRIQKPIYLYVWRGNEVEVYC